MYYLPFSGKTRFAAFPDTPEIETELDLWLSNGTTGRTWTDLKANASLQSKLVDGTAILNVFFKKEKTFVSNDTGLPQIKYNGNPKSLLFVFGHYQVSSGSGSFSYGKLETSYTRHEISAHFYEQEQENLESVWQGISQLQQDKVNRSYIQGLEATISKLRADVVKLAKRNDPLATVMPALAAESGEREAQILDILQQLNTLQAPLAVGVTDVTNYPTKDEFYDQISKKTSRGYVDGLIATKASESEFLSHVFDETLHNPTYLQVGSPSNAQHAVLSTRMSSAEDRLTNLEALDPIQSLTTVGGILATDMGNGVWKINSSGVGVGTGDKPQETAFYMGGMLSIAQDTGGKVYIWEDATIIGVHLSLGVESDGAPVTIDLKKNGTSIYTVKPSIPEGQKDILAALPNDVDLEQGDYLTADVLNVGTGTPGADLTIQVRYQYAQ